MISFIRGTLEAVTESSVIVDCGGIGYEVLTTSSVIGRLAVMTGQEVKLHTSLQVREDGVSLIGFLAREELDTFAILCSVSGVGTKAALSILSAMSPGELMLAVMVDDVAALSKAQGIGKKIAQRLALELKDKFKGMTPTADTGSALGGAAAASALSMGGGAKQDALEALVALSYGRSEALRAVMEVAQEDMDAEAIVKLALKKLLAK